MLCENCQRPATRTFLLRGGGTAATCGDCNPVGWDGTPPTPIASPTPVDPTKVALLTRADAAAYVGVSEDHFDRNVRPHVRVRMVGNKPMFRPQDLDEFAAGGSKPL